MQVLRTFEATESQRALRDAMSLSAADVAVATHRADFAVARLPGGAESAMTMIASAALMPGSHATLMALFFASSGSQSAHEFGAGDPLAHWDLVHERARLAAVLAAVPIPHDSIGAPPAAVVYAGPPVAAIAELVLVAGVGPALKTTMSMGAGEWASMHEVFHAAVPVLDMTAPLLLEAAPNAGDGGGLSDGLAAAVPEAGRLIEEALACDLQALERAMERFLQRCDRLLTPIDETSAQLSVLDAAQAAVLCLCVWELARWRRTPSSEEKPFSAERVSGLTIWPDGPVEDGQ
jgi:hypothetical protein